MSASTRSDKAMQRPTSLLTTMLPGLISLVVLIAMPTTSLADAHGGAADAAAGAAEAPAASDLKSTMEQQLDQMPTGDAGVNLIMGEMNKRLNLTEAQQTEIRPIIQKAVDSMEKTRARYKAGEITTMALGMQMQMASQRASKAVEPLLTDTQKVEYAAMQQEQRRAAMEQMKKAQGMGQ